MTRRESREHLFCLLFQKDFYKEQEYEQQIEIYCDEKNIHSQDDISYLTGRLEKLLEKRAEIDQLIEDNAKGWKLDRIANAEKAILRIAVYEAMFDEDIPVSVAINEAVELSKQYGDDHAPSFVNGILGKIVNE